MTAFATTPGGEFRSVSLDSPVGVLAGDTIAVVGDTIVISRAGVVIATRSLIGPSVPMPMVVTESQLIESAVFFRRTPVVGVMATLTNVRKNLTTGTLTFEYSDGQPIEFSDGAQVMTETDHIDTDNTLAKQILARKTLLNSPDETNLTTMIGAVCYADCKANQPISITVE